MGYCIEPLDDWKKAVDSTGSYAYAILYRISDLLVCPAGMIRAEDWTECYEARLFCRDAELHLIMDDEKERKAIRITDDGAEDDVIIREYLLDTGRVCRRFLPDNATRLVVKQYLKMDQDGQVYIALTRLSDIQ